MSAITKILVANRGEIAVRVLRTAKSLGYRTVAVYSDADADALHVRAADQAVCIGAPAVAESYLQGEKILDAARRSGADAIHPGYGFLSENAQFARRCEEAGISFIGPGADAIALMSSKRHSKLAMLAAGVPCVPGYQGEGQTLEQLCAQAERIGFPVMIKASAGGGGRGMRLVQSAAQLAEQIKTAKSESLSAFGCDELIVEKALLEPRHIEIQVFADCFGNTVYLGERDCSIQRRHQKVVEEAPSPFVDEALRRRMGETAVNAARACQYRGAGTVEFLVDADKNFYFLEMNTRLQVEHPVTELVTGIDLVEWQLRVAAGEMLPLRQEDISLQGHAIEVRLYAEDPRNGFLPQTGRALRWLPPQGEGLRVDHGLREGQTIGAHYDPMLAKIIACGESRELARRRLACAIEDTVLLGVNHNKQFLAHVLRHPDFAAAKVTTAFIEQQFGADDCLQAAEPPLSALALAALLFYCRRAEADACGQMSGWTNSVALSCRSVLGFGGRDYALQISTAGGASSYRISCAEQSLSLTVLELTAAACVYELDGLRQTLHYACSDNCLYLDAEWGNMCFENRTHLPVASASAGGAPSTVVAAMDGLIVDVLVAAGDTVTKGQTVAVLEAMKMEHPLKAAVDGVVAALHTAVGEQVRLRQCLLELCPADEAVMAE